MGHRGSPIEAPENTVASFQKAVEQGVKAIEIDAICTQDGQVVCSHNHDLERETSGSGYIHETSYENLRTVDAGVNLSNDSFFFCGIFLFSRLATCVGRHEILSFV